MHLADMEYILRHDGIMRTNVLEAWIHKAIDVINNDQEPNCDETIEVLMGSTCPSCLDHGNERTNQDRIEVCYYVVRMVNHSVAFGHPRVALDLYIQFMDEWTQLDNS